MPAGPLARPLLCRRCVGPLARSSPVPAPCCPNAHMRLLLLLCRYNKSNKVINATTKDESKEKVKTIH